MSESYLQLHLDLLKKEDKHFAAFWDALSQDQRDGYLANWRLLDGFASQHAENLERLHSGASEFTRRWFVRVQEKEFSYSAIRTDWPVIARSPEALSSLLDGTSERLQDFLGIVHLEQSVAYYGGVKPLDSIDEKLLQSREGDAVQRRLTDLWDLVRFRLVTDDLDDLLSLAIQFWELFLDDVVRCRNYYYRPRNGFSADAYRAIHFELKDRESNLAEIQMMTSNREAVSLLDHWHIFKGSGSFVDAAHEEWIKLMSYSANVVDSETFRELDPLGETRIWEP